MGDPVSWWWPVLVYGVIGIVVVVGMLCRLPLDHLRYGRIGALAHFGVFFVIAGTFFAAAVYLTANDNEAGWYALGAGFVFLVLAWGSWRHAKSMRRAPTVREK